MQWLEAQDLDGNGIPNGYGMMEIHGMNGEMIDVAAYTVQGWEALYHAAVAMKDTNHTDEWAGKKAEALKMYINGKYWVAEADAYADVRGTKTQVLELIDGAIVRAEGLNKPWAVEELETTKKAAASGSAVNPYSIHHNWIVNTPMEVGFAPEEYALKALDKAAQYTNPFGMFVTGIDRDESAGTDTDGFAKRKKTFTYVGAVMTLPTGVAAVAENNYSRPDKALDYLHRMSRSWGYAHPGSMYEVSPDFGMMCQAWNIYSFAYPIVRQFFGVQPDPQQHKITIDLAFPSNWTHPQLKGIAIGEGELQTYLDVAFLKGDAKRKNQLLLIQEGPNVWTLRTKIPKGAEVMAGDQIIKPTLDQEGYAEMTDREVVIRW